LIEMTAGYKQDPAKILSRIFRVEHDELITLDHIEFTSMCEHHMMIFAGQVHVGYIPAPRKGVVGISKIARLVDCYAKRLQVQERMTQQIAGAIQDHLEPLGVAVVIEARHYCVCARGVGKQSSIMRTSSMLGVMRDKPEARAEFLKIIKGAT
jgi:GTP cyclohydrolase I